MRKFLIAAALAITTGSAFAADMAPYVKAPPIAVPTWAGGYIGINLGGAWGEGSPSFSNPFTSPGSIFAVCGSPAGVAPAAPIGGPSTDCGRGSSFIGGAQAGYNWQTGAWVYGVEVDGAWQRLINRSFTRFGSNPTGGAPMGSVATDTAYVRSEMDGLGTFRGRIGYAPSNWMVYVTGGLAVGGVNNSVTEILAPGNACFAGGCRVATDDSIRAGWTVGAGAEWMFAPKWSVGAEYLYVDLGKSTITAGPIGGFFTNTSVSTFENTEHVVRAKVNYHF